jgi:cell division protein ZapA (FtsZ GTPase activity inhibitor)
MNSNSLSMVQKRLMIQGRTLWIRCPEEELLRMDQAEHLLNEILRDIDQHHHPVDSDSILMMAALHLAHECIRYSSGQNNLLNDDLSDTMERIEIKIQEALDLSSQQLLSPADTRESI